MTPPEFRPFNKIPRYSRTAVVTEKIDGTNASIHWTENGEMFVGSRNRWITPESDNYNFAEWAYANKEELRKLGPGTHFGEWWGLGIQRRYGMKEKVFSLFNTARWLETPPPACCRVVPVLYSGPIDTMNLDGIIAKLRSEGSIAAPGFMDPEGVVIYHTAGRLYFKKTIKNDAEPKSLVRE